MRLLRRFSDDERALVAAGRMITDSEPMTHRQQIDREGHEPIRRGWLGDPFSMTVNAVCCSCNNGWMSRVESGAQPYLETMLRGRGRQLHEGAQRALATWAMKTALMSEHTQPSGGRVFPGELYAYLYEHHEPPAGIRVWIASYTGAWPAFGHAYGLDTDAPDQDSYRDRRDIYGSTIALGPAAFQMFGTTFDGLTDEITSSAEHIVHQLWPYRRSFTWAPRPAFEDDQLVRFADGIAQIIIQGARASRDE